MQHPVVSGLVGTQKISAWVKDIRIPTFLTRGITPHHENLIFHCTGFEQREPGIIPRAWPASRNKKQLHPLLGQAPGKLWEPQIIADDHTCTDNTGGVRNRKRADGASARKVSSIPCRPEQMYLVIPMHHATAGKHKTRICASQPVVFEANASGDTTESIPGRCLLEPAEEGIVRQMATCPVRQCCIPTINKLREEEEIKSPQ